ncbi:MAG: hypothetical protein ABIO70_26300 [Pseudomonadota bacterium]
MGTARAAILALALTGCPAERLGVPLPPRGEAAIGQEDVQRDLYLFTPGAWNLVDPEEALPHRFAEVGLEPAFDGDYGQGGATCGRHDGEAGPALLVIAQTDGPGVSQSTLRAASLVSLAKSVDRLETTSSVLFCYLHAEAGAAFDASPPLPWSAVGEVVVLGSLAGAVLSTTAEPWRGHDAHRFTGGPDPLAGTAADGIERLDYRAIEAHLRVIHRDVLAPLIKDPPPAEPPPPPH